MNKPIRPRQPWESSYEEQVVPVTLYEFKESLSEEDTDYCDACAKLYPECICKECWECGEEVADCKCSKRISNEANIRDISLGWIVDKANQLGIDVNQIKMNFGYNASSMALEDHYISFYYETTEPARLEEYKRDLAQYEEELVQYEKDMIVYKEFLQSEQIEKAKAELKRLEDLKMKRDNKAARKQANAAKKEKKKA